MHEDERTARFEHDRVTTRILLLDDHRMVIEALGARLAAEPDIQAFTRAPGGLDTTVAYAAQIRPDVVVLEVAPFDEVRRQLLTALRGRLPHAHLVVLSADDDPATAAEVARLGAEGWVSKAAGVDDLVALVRDAAGDRGWFPPEQLGTVLARLRADAHRATRSDGPLDALTDRERDVLAAMVEGRSTTAVAAHLRVSCHTVRTHISSIYVKLAVHSRLEAVAVARAAGLAERLRDGASVTA